MTQYWSTLINALAQDQMKELVLDNQEIPQQKWGEICHYIAKSLNLNTIVINGCRLDGGYMNLLTLGLLRNISVKYLMLSNMSIKDDMETIAQLLKTNCILETIEIVKCNIDDMGFGMLLSGLAQNDNSKLSKLSLFGNKIKGEVLSNAKHNYSFGLITDLNLSHNIFSEIGFQDLSSILGSSQNIQHLQLNYCIGNYAENWDESTLQGCLDWVFGNNQGLSSVALSQNDLGDKNIKIVLRSLLKNSIKLDSLALASNKLTADVLPALAEFVNNTPSLKTLSLTDNNVAMSATKSEFAIDLSWAYQLREIQLCYNPINIRYIQGINEFIANSNAQLITLSQVFAIEEEEEDNTVFNSLQRQNNINNLVLALSKCKASVLYLDINCIFNVGDWCSILGGLSQNKYIKGLMLNDNVNIEHVPSCYWDKLIKNGVLQELDLSCNDFSCKALKKICTAMAGSRTLTTVKLVIEYDDEKFAHIANLIKSNSSINELVLFYDYIYESKLTSNNLQLLAEAIEQNNTLRCLQMPPVNMSPQIVSLLVEKLSKNQSLTEIIFNYLPGDDELNEQCNFFYTECIKKTIAQLGTYKEWQPSSMLEIMHLLQRLESSLLCYKLYNKESDYSLYEAAFLEYSISLRQSFFKAYGYYTQLPEYINANLIYNIREENIKFLEKMLNTYSELIDSDDIVIEYYKNLLQCKDRIFKHAQYILRFLCGIQPIELKDAKELNSILLLYEGDTHINYFCSVIKQYIMSSRDKTQVAGKIIENYNMVSQLLEGTSCQPLKQIKNYIDGLSSTLGQWRQQIENDGLNREMGANTMSRVRTLRQWQQETEEERSPEPKPKRHCGR